MNIFLKNHLLYHLWLVDNGDISMKNNKFFIFLFIMISVLFCMCGCRQGEFADDYKNVRWYSNQPEMEFTIYEPYTSGTGYIIVNEQKIEIYCVWGNSTNLLIYRSSDYNENEKTFEAPPCLSFSYTIKNRVVSLSVLSDKLFDGIYDNQIIKLYCEDL